MGQTCSSTSTKSSTLPRKVARRSSPPGIGMSHTSLLSSMEAIAREAGALLMEHFRARVTIEYKGDVDLVTIADRQSEALILNRIRSLYPAHDVMGEEGTR